jgi:molybdopterin molybdotransferase
MPAGADSVVSAELARAEGEDVWVSAPISEGVLIRPAGVDARSGDVLVPAGRRLSSPELGILASAGQGGALAYPKVRVAVFAVGELVEPGKPASVGELRDANSVSVFGALRDLGAQSLRIGIVPDDDAELREAIVSNLTRADCFVCTVGAAATDPELGAVALMKDLEWLDVGMHPPVRMGFGLVEDTPFFALPGSPVSVFAAFELFIRPAILKMMGRGDVHRPEVHAVLDEAVDGPAGVGLYVPARVSHREGAWHARPTGPPDPNLLSPIVRANGLVVVAPEEAKPAAGDRVLVQIFRPLER